MPWSSSFYVEKHFFFIALERQISKYDPVNGSSSPKVQNLLVTLLLLNSNIVYTVGHMRKFLLRLI